MDFYETEGRSACGVVVCVDIPDREKAKMEEMDRISRMRDGAPKRRGRRKGITLLMTLLRTSLPNLWRIALSLGVAGLFHILQVTRCQAILLLRLEVADACRILLHRIVQSFPIVGTNQL